MSLTSPTTSLTSSHAFTNSPLWLLGHCYRLLGPHPTYHPIPLPPSPPTPSPSTPTLTLTPTPLPHPDRRAAFYADLSSRLWFSYRSAFPPIHPAYPSVTSDAGWGCMIRSTQMMLAHAFTLHYLGREWRRRGGGGGGGGGGEKGKGGGGEEQEEVYLALLSWFLDSPASPYSIHSLLTTPPPPPTPSSSSSPTSSSPSSPRVGEWFGPTATCQMLLRCRAAHVAAAGGEASIDVPKLLVTDDGTLYWDKIVRLCVTRGGGGAGGQKWGGGGGDGGKGSWTFDPEVDVFHPVVVFIPLRLGVDRLNPAYLPSLLSTFQYPQTIGLMGGKPRTSFYFVGVQDDRLLYLDPHTVQPALPHSSHLLRAAEVDSFHTSRVSSMAATAIDPSLAIGFYLRTWEDWVQLAEQAKRMEELEPVYAVVRVREKRGWKGRDEREEEEGEGVEVGAVRAEAAMRAERGEGEEEGEDGNEEKGEVREDEKSEQQTPHRSQSTPRSHRSSQSEVSGSRSRAKAEAEKEGEREDSDDDFVLL